MVLEFTDNESDNYIEQENIIEEVEYEEDYEALGEETEETFKELDDQQLAFSKHRDSVYCISLDPNNSSITVSGGGDDVAYVWNNKAGELIHVLDAHTDSVISAGFSHDSTYIATGGMDGKVCIWSAAEGTLILELEGPDEVVHSKNIDWHPKGNVILASGNDGVMWMWQIPLGTLMNVFGGHAGPITKCRFTNSGKRIISAGEDCKLMVWDPRNANVPVMRLSHEIDHQFHRESITDFAINSDDTLVLTASADGSAILTNILSERIMAAFKHDAETGGMEAVDFSASMPFALTASLSGSVYVWDLHSLTIRTKIQSNEGGITKAFWHPSKPFLTAGFTSGTVCIWDGRTGKLVRSFEDMRNEAVLSLVQSSDGNTIITGLDDGRVVTIDASEMFTS